MPGLAGGIGIAPELRAALRQWFTGVWSDALVFEEGDALLTAHSFSSPALHVDAHRAIGIDGSAAAYRHALAHRCTDAATPQFDLPPDFMGNVALIDPARGTLQLVTEWTGTFPLYYIELAGGLLFSSHPAPLGRLARSGNDVLGTMQILQTGAAYNGRSAYRNVVRLQPGQALRFERGGRASVEEKSRLWSGADLEPTLDEVLSVLHGAIDRHTGHAAAPALMMSAGWDSRTLLALLQARARCYTHGDVQSREISIVRRLCSRAGVGLLVEPIDERVWDIANLEAAFNRIGSVVFPHWIRAGSVLAGQGVDCVAAGVYGEVLGGHYGPAMLMGGRAKIASVLKSLVRADSADTDGSSVGPLLDRPLDRPWYLTADVLRSLDPLDDEYRTEVRTAVARLEARGVPHGARMIEALISEQRGTQYINMQLLSCRAHLDVAIPFAERELLAIATRIPLGHKVHNLLNRLLLARAAPELLGVPLAATLVAADSPVFVQETSRLVRRVAEEVRWRAHFASKRKLAAPRLGWANFEFLRSRDTVHTVIDALQADIWNRPALLRVAAQVRDGSYPATLHPLFDQLSKIYTVDLMLR